MRSFACDYIAGAHPEIIKRLTETNLEVLPGYTEDKYCMSATEKIKKACQREDLEIFYLVGGTQTNQIVIDTMLENYEGVVAAKTGHVSIHEAGAIEFSGHKVLEIGVVEHIGRTGVEIAHGHTAVDFAEDCNFGTVGELVEVSRKGEGFKECATFIGDRDGFSSVGAEEENLECVETDHHIGVFDKVSVDESFGNGVL